MQDNDSNHTSKLWQRDIKSKEEQHALQLIFCPAQPADLNPIERVWDELDQKVRAKHATSTANFWQVLQESWAELSSVYIKSLVERLSRIYEAMIVTKGGHFHGWNDL